MAWVYGLFLAIIFVMLMVVSRVFRNIILNIIVFLVLGGWFMYKYNIREEEKRLNAISPNEIELRNPTLRYNHGYDFVTVAKNNSKYFDMSSIDISISAFDCPAGDPVDWPNCEEIGQDIVSIYSHIPPGQVRQLNGRLHFDNMPSPKGRFVWNYSIKQIRSN